MLEKQIIIERIFNAPKKSVWEAWTDPEIVKKWWGPEGFWSPSVKIDLKVGGKYIFCMHGPKDTEFDNDMYSAGTYREIIPNEKLMVTDYFSDEQGNKVEPKDYGMKGEFPSEQEVTVRFGDVGDGKTKLTIEYQRPQSEAQFEAMKKSGMEQGWSSSLDKLAEALKN